VNEIIGGVRAKKSLSVGAPDLARNNRKSDPSTDCQSRFRLIMLSSRIIANALFQIKDRSPNVFGLYLERPRDTLLCSLAFTKGAL
jgi:hypothetical protein